MVGRYTRFLYDRWRLKHSHGLGCRLVNEKSGTVAGRYRFERLPIHSQQILRPSIQNTRTRSDYKVNIFTEFFKILMPEILERNGILMRILEAPTPIGVSIVTNLRYLLKIWVDRCQGKMVN